jgi:uncharacterized damage-inducible protein DinB
LTIVERDPRLTPLDRRATIPPRFRPEAVDVEADADMNTLNKLVDHCVWANGQWIGFVAEAFPGDEFPVVRMSHILLGERAWFQRIAGQEPDPKIWRVIAIPELRELHTQHEGTFRQLLAGNLERVIAYKRFTGEEYQSPVSDILLHLTLHGAHHRGQIATYVSNQGKAPINTDFVQYCLRYGR